MHQKHQSKALHWFPPSVQELENFLSLPSLACLLTYYSLLTYTRRNRTMRNKPPCRNQLISHPNFAISGMGHNSQLNPDCPKAEFCDSSSSFSTALEDVFLSMSYFLPYLYLRHHTTCIRMSPELHNIQTSGVRRYFSYSP